MKRILIFTALIAFTAACKKENTTSTNKVRYLVVGDHISEIKYNINDISYSVKKDFASGWDTTFSNTSLHQLELQAKSKNSTSGSLSAFIYLNDQVVEQQTSTTKDSTGSYSVKIQHEIK